MQQHARRRGDAGRGEHDLRQLLVHGDGAAKIAAAGVFHTGQVQRSLQLAVFALLAVQGKKCDVRQPAQLDDVRPDQGTAARLPDAAQLMQIRGLLADAPVQILLRLVEYRAAGAEIALEAKKQIHQQHPMASAAQRTRSVRTAGDGNIPLV